MKIGMITLRFDAGSNEREFRERYDRQHLFSNRIGTTLSFAVWAVICTVVWFTFPQHRLVVFAVFAGGLAPLMALSFVVTLVPRWHRYSQAVAALVNAATACAHIYVALYLGGFLWYLVIGMVLMSIYAFFIFRLRFVIALPLTVSYSVLTQALLALDAPPVALADLVIMYTLLWVPLAGAVIGGYSLERAERLLFVSVRELTMRNDEIEHDLDIARQIVSRLLPETLPARTGYLLHAFYRPMDKVGGDYYDVRLTNGTLSLFIADVSGHGLASSYLALIGRMALDAVSGGERGSARSVLLAVNDAICRSTVAYNYMTAIYAAIDCASREMRFCCAGHPPMLLHRRADGSLAELRTRGKPLGWDEDPGLREESIALRPGDRLVLFTDGITESRNRAGAMFGDERFTAFVRSSAGLSGEGFASGLIAELASFTGTGFFDDDVTLILCDVT